MKKPSYHVQVLVHVLRVILSTHVELRCQHLQVLLLCVLWSRDPQVKVTGPEERPIILVHLAESIRARNDSQDLALPVSISVEHSPETICCAIVPSVRGRLPEVDFSVGKRLARRRLHMNGEQVRWVC